MPPTYMHVGLLEADKKNKHDVPCTRTILAVLASKNKHYTICNTMSPPYCMISFQDSCQEASLSLVERTRCHDNTDATSKIKHQVKMTIKDTDFFKCHRILKKHASLIAVTNHATKQYCVLVVILQHHSTDYIIRGGGNLKTRAHGKLPPHIARPNRYQMPTKRYRSSAHNFRAARPQRTPLSGAETPRSRWTSAVAQWGNKTPRRHVRPAGGGMKERNDTNKKAKMRRREEARLESWSRALHTLSCAIHSSASKYVSQHGNSHDSTAQRSTKLQ